MSDGVELVRSLLTALRHAGGEQEAAVFESRFAANGWRVGAEDHLQLTSAIQRVLGRAADPQRAVSPVAPPRHRLLASFSPWIATLPGGHRFLDAVERLLAARSFDEVCVSLDRIFVEGLGYERRGIEEHERLGDQVTFTRSVVVAVHDGFHVLAVESRYAGPYAQVFDPLFRLRPHALVVTLERGCKLRIVARRASTSHGPRNCYRTMRGIGDFAAPDDDVLTYSRRFALLQPGARDTRADLVRRAEHVVVASPREIGEAWSSVEVDPAAIDGPSWDRVSAGEVERFLQTSIPVADRLADGLELELCSALPWCSSVGGIKIEYVRSELVAEPDDVETCVIRRADHCAVLRVELVHERLHEDGRVVRNPISVMATVLVPDDTGTYVIAGELLRHDAGALAEAAVDFEADADDGVESEIDDADASSEPASRGDESGEAEPADTHDPSAGNDVYTGVSQVALLRNVVAKRLRTIGYAFSRLPVAVVATPELAHGWLVLRFGDEHGRLRMSAVPLLRRHLRAGAGRSRAIRVADAAPLPAWACPEATSTLASGSALPVSGARLAPGGVLAVPRAQPDGRVCLAGASDDAFAFNPRFASAHAESRSPLWIYEPWSDRVHTGPGTATDPRDAEIVVPLEATVVRRSAPAARVVLSSTCARRRIARRQWTFDLPVVREATLRPAMQLKPGQELRCGEVIAELDPRCWTPRARSEEHIFMRRAREVVFSPQGGEDAERMKLRCPPSLAGRVSRAGCTEVHDRLGNLLAYRLFVETWTELAAHAARIADGRRVPIDVRDPADLPSSLEDGRHSPAVFEDDGDTIGALATDDDWIDGHTGEALEGVTVLRRIDLVYESPCVLPDPDLRVRAVDGLGIPRAGGDARLTHATLRWWRAIDPGAAATVDEAAAAPHGWPAAATSLYDLAIASHVDVPPSVPTEWARPSVREHVASEHDPLRPLRTRRHARRGETIDGKTAMPSQHRWAPWAWSCQCGLLCGGTHAFEVCEACGVATEPRVRGEGLPPIGAIPLAAQILHPWRKSVVAALLGLTVEELGQITRAHDASALIEVTQLAMAQPDRSLLQRLARVTGTREKEAITEGFVALEPVLRGRLRFDDLWISELCLLPTRLLFDACPSGATDLLVSPFTTHYRMVAAAAELLAQANEAGEPLLRSLTWVRLQRAVDDLFGAIESPERGTLAELWRRIWPTTAPAEIEFSVAGLFLDCSVATIRGWSMGRVFGGPPPERTPDPTIPLGILRDGEVIELPRPTPPDLALTSSRAHEDRNAWAWITGQALPSLAAVCLGIDAASELRALVRPALPETLHDSLDVGRVVLRELLTAIAPPHGHASGVRRLLASNRAEVLPAERDLAISAVIERLRAAFGYQHPGTALVESVLGAILSGFWRGPPCDEAPAGWIWRPDGERLPRGYRRTVPRLVDAAWAQWPGFLLLTAPVRCAALGLWRQAISPGHLAWLGADSSEPVERWWSDAEVITMPSRDESMPPIADAVVPESATVAETPEASVAKTAAFETEVRVLDCTVRTWLARHEPRANDGR